MSKAFVWFHNGTEQQSAALKFYQELLGWQTADGPPGMHMLAGEHGPFAAIGKQEGGVSGWVPYVQVDDVDSATEQATSLGARILQPKTKGPAGQYTLVRDPGGAAIALWQQA